MTFLVQNIEQYNIILTQTRMPTIKGEPIRLLKILHEKLTHLPEGQVCHLVLDISGLERSSIVPAQHYVTVIAKLYEAWHYRQNLKLWLVVDESSLDMARYMAQKYLLPMVVYHETAEVFKQIVQNHSETGQLASQEAQN